MHGTENRNLLLQLSILPQQKTLRRVLQSSILTELMEYKQKMVPTKYFRQSLMLTVQQTIQFTDQQLCLFRRQIKNITERQRAAVAAAAACLHLSVVMVLSVVLLCLSLFPLQSKLRLTTLQINLSSYLSPVEL